MSFYQWASVQPVWVQVFIALVLFFVVLPIALAGLVTVMNATGKLAGELAGELAGGVRDALPALLAFSGLAAVIAACWLIAMWVAGFAPPDPLATEPPERGPTWIVVAVFVPLVLLTGWVAWRLAAPLRKTAQKWLIELEGGSRET